MGFLAGRGGGGGGELRRYGIFFKVGAHCVRGSAVTRQCFLEKRSLGYFCFRV